MDTHTALFPHGQSFLADGPVWLALQKFSVLCSATPSTFKAKAEHFRASEKSNTAVVIIDVLRATTTLTAVAAAGARGINIAVKPKSGTPFVAPTPAPERWAFGGEENGRPIPGGCLGNSPVEVSNAMVREALFRFVSTNGARAVDTALNAGFEKIYLACLPNIEATVAEALADGAKRLFFAGGGFYESGTLEDTVCAGFGVKSLIERGFADGMTLDDEACMALTVSCDYVDPDRLIRTLKAGQVGRLLTEIGRGADVEAVVIGAGVDPAIWRRMATTVLRYAPRNDGLGLFVPTQARAQKEKVQ